MSPYASNCTAITCASKRNLLRRLPEAICSHFDGCPKQTADVSAIENFDYTFTGSAKTFQSVDAWRPVVEKMRGLDRLGSSLPLQCPRHRDRVRAVETSKTLEQIVNSRMRVCEDCGI